MVWTIYFVKTHYKVPDTNQPASIDLRFPTLYEVCKYLPSQNSFLAFPNPCLKNFHFLLKNCDPSWRFMNTWSIKMHITVVMQLCCFDVQDGEGQYNTSCTIFRGLSYSEINFIIQIVDRYKEINH